MGNLYEKVIEDLQAQGSPFPEYKKGQKVIFMGETCEEPATVWGHDNVAYMDALGVILAFDNYPSMMPMTVHPRWIRRFPLTKQQLRQQLRVVCND